MSYINSPKFIGDLRRNYTKLMAEGQKRQEASLRMSIQDAENLLTAALAQTIKENISSGHIIDDSKLAGNPQTWDTLFSVSTPENGTNIRH